ncbi:hypothetical protein MLD38_004694 [Melastoma candidum]|uniref:Uncharacterized protein n=1 Tax=Melastoma candidum TaxID=119954 RepID=A0ACB9S7T5_9MYRT|nr:hypothetical protein MLD38_004694 [Melastoma candidum]
MKARVSAGLYRALVIVVVLFRVCLPRGHATTYWGDVQFLKELKGSVEPGSVRPGSCLASWDFSIDPCDSLFGDKFTCGFRCDESLAGSSETRRVTEIALDQAGYSGTISSLPWGLPTYLQTIDLSGNSFNGRIPDSLSALHQLTRLSLSGNSFSGGIPESVSSLSALQELYLDNNALEGMVPPSLVRLTRLTRLDVQSNRLWGELPDLSSMSSLLYLDASNNVISGKVPTGFPPSIIQITMRNNQLQGPVPQNLQSLTSLQVLDLSHNLLVGPVPFSLFTHPSLQQLTLSNNALDSIPSPGPFYPIPMPTSALVSVDLSNNSIRGVLPMFLATMPMLSALDLEDNMLTGMIPVQYAIKAVLGGGAGVSRFERLFLGGNYLFGPIPSPLMGMKVGGGGGGSAGDVRLGDNCLYRCPASFFFCGGGRQKTTEECKKMFGPSIP